MQIFAPPPTTHSPPSFAHPKCSVRRPSCAFAYAARDVVWSANVAAVHDASADAGVGADAGVCACGMDADTSCRPVRASQSR